MNDNGDAEDPVIYIVIGRVWDHEEGTEETATPVHVLLKGADDDDAVRKTLEALTAKGFVEAELDQIGVMEGEPDDPTYEAAYEDALTGNVAVITFAE